MLDPQTATLLERFEANTLEALSHEDHVRVAWAMVRTLGLRNALASFPTALKAFASARGAHDLYNETITWLYLLLIDERCSRLDLDHGWTEFAASNPDLLDDHNRLLARYYTSERLASPEAKTRFLLPDRVPASNQAAAC